jgi:hypothetical protein
VNDAVEISYEWGIGLGGLFALGDGGKFGLGVGFGFRAHPDDARFGPERRV